MFFETSAKTGTNVENVFSLAAKENHLAKAAQLEKDRAVSNPYGSRKGNSKSMGGGSITNPSRSTLSNS